MAEKIIPQPEMKQMMLDIMQDIHDFCEKNGLRYYLAFGTMIGAVRHKGFIPWDDDIDLWMPRPDYDRLRKEFQADGLYLVDLAELTSGLLEKIRPYAALQDGLEQRIKDIR